MVKQTMSTFPDRQASYEKLYHTLDVINDQEAERTFKVGEYYKRTGKVASAEFYFGKIPQRWPGSPWAVKAKTELAQLAKMPRKPSVPSKIMSRRAPSTPTTAPGRWAWAWAADGRHGRHGHDAGRNDVIDRAIHEAEVPAPKEGPDHARHRVSNHERPIVSRPACRLRLICLLATVARPRLGGCGYSIRAPFDKSVKTVFVPVFKTQSFRRDLNLNLTEMIQKEIKYRTPYKVVGTPGRRRHGPRGNDQLRRQEHRGREPVQPAPRAEHDHQP